jgi:hypothetical protein
MWCNREFYEALFKREKADQGLVELGLPGPALVAR